MELGLKILICILIISLFFGLVRVLVDKYLSDFYREFFKKIGILKNIFRAKE